MANLGNALAQWSADGVLAFPASAKNRAAAAILDTVGCLIAGARDPAVAGAASLAADTPSGKAASVGHRSRIPAPWAALVNACAAHALDFDDNFFPAITHASAVLVPALLALADECGAAPADVVHAYIVGLEVEAQIGKLVNPSHYESGWHATSTIGAIGAAAACARLLRLDQAQTLNAISIATSLAGGSKKQFGSMVKPLHAGFAAMHGVMAARLASAGVKGNGDMLQGTWSFEELFAGNADQGLLEPALFPDAPLAIDEFGLVSKLYPSCMSSHLGIDALLGIRRTSAFRAEDVVSIDIYLPAFMVANLRYADPQDEMEARFSMHYCAAVAVVSGVPRLSDFSKSVLEAPEMRAMMQRVRMHIREPSLDSRNLPWGGDGAARIALSSGEIIEQAAAYPKGCKQNPLTAEEQRNKFKDCAAPILGAARAKALLAELDRFIAADSVAGVTGHFQQCAKV